MNETREGKFLPQRPCPLYRIAFEGDVVAVKTFLENKGDPNTRVKTGTEHPWLTIDPSPQCTAPLLAVACRCTHFAWCDHDSKIPFILDDYVDPRRDNTGREWQLPVVDMLLEAKADVNGTFTTMFSDGPFGYGDWRPDGYTAYCRIDEQCYDLRHLDKSPQLMARVATGSWSGGQDRMLVPNAFRLRVLLRLYGATETKSMHTRYAKRWIRETAAVRYIQDYKRHYLPNEESWHFVMRMAVFSWDDEVFGNLPSLHDDLIFMILSYRGYPQWWTRLNRGQ
jgi:hypothetical protein